MSGVFGVKLNGFFTSFNERDVEYANIIFFLIKNTYNRVRYFKCRMNTILTTLSFITLTCTNKSELNISSKQRKIQNKHTQNLLPFLRKSMHKRKNSNIRTHSHAYIK